MKYLTSLSFGVKTMVKENIDPAEVIIIAGTRFDNPEQAIESYGEYSWKPGFCEEHEKVWDTCRKVWPRVIQPRAIYGDEHYPKTSNKVYDDLKELEEWCSGMPYNVITELMRDGYLK